MNINDVIQQNKTKKRGRPRKNLCVGNKQKVDKKSDLIEEDIIIHLPISSQEINDEKIDGLELIKTECNEDAQQTTESISSDENQNNVKYQDLLNTLKEKDKLIAELTEKLSMHENKTNVSTAVVRGINIHQISPVLDTNSDGNIIIPEHTEISCLWDTCAINGIPCFLPERYYDNKFYVIGCFCSLNCAVSYNLQLDDCKTSERYSLLKWMYKKTNDVLIPAPSCQILDKYGGKVTIEDYRKNLISCQKDFRIMMPPMACIYQTLEERIYKTQSHRPQNNVIDAMKHKTKK